MNDSTRIYIFRSYTNESCPPSACLDSCRDYLDLRDLRMPISSERIEEIIELVRKLYDGQSVDEGLLIKRELNGKEYRQLLNRLAEDHELQEYIRDKLR
jgi:hypothetical protein